ncbi:pre-mRNA-splicing factor syf2 [Zalerion maritima]|uniref:Pre-mRNA-splicing factor SYF2 n=1 Tax=Zalerion maritima TaxID=339359 RepID=A0AAD5WN44_9PEZI|nr:pre-mRNA-splicing factor syf2 [Zalerion maritima]
MPPAKKRKTESGSEPSAPAVEDSQSSKPQNGKQDNDEAAMPTTSAADTTGQTETKPVAPDSYSAAAARLARFKALQARAKTSSESNLQAASQETKRLAANPAALAAIQRKSASASQKLLRAEVEEAGEDFERKRAWDWTVDESEAWDKHVRKRATARDGVAFQDYRQEANKVYKRQLKNLSTPDLERYDKERLEALEKAARSGELDIIETEDGEMVAVDKSGAFYADADSTTFAQHKPDKEAIKRVVEDVNRADEQRMKKRRERMAKNGDEGDVTYINEKNKQFNQKLDRYYNKYTAEIRDSFERGTMI